MPKQTLEFTPVLSFPLSTPSSSSSSSSTPTASTRTLSKDPETGDSTLILYHPPGQEWGGSKGVNEQASHDYFEECLILKGRLYDKTLKEWFGEGMYCCRPKGMLHGPWRADEVVGCEEVVWIRY